MSQAERAHAKSRVWVERASGAQVDVDVNVWGRWGLGPHCQARQVMMRALCDARGHCFDSHLAQADSLRALFIGLNDQVNAVCATTIQLVNRRPRRSLPPSLPPSLRRRACEQSAGCPGRQPAASLVSAVMARYSISCSCVAVLGAFYLTGLSLQCIQGSMTGGCPPSI